MKEIFILGIEGTAWNFSAAIVNSKDIIAESKSTYVPKQGGIHPREAAQHHSSNAPIVIKELLEKFYTKGYNINDISGIAFSNGPGLGPCLRVCATVARMLSLIFKKPLIAVNHCIAHIEIGLWDTKLNDPIILYVSGANTQILSFNLNKYRVLGETLDIGLGNSIDKFARSAGLQHPGGPKVELLSKNSTKLLNLPYTVKGMDLFYSGLSECASRKIKYDIHGNIINLEDICYSYQEIAFAMAVEVVERALAHTQKNEVMVVGGVGANLRLQEMLLKMCISRNCTFRSPSKQYMGDNGVMIARAGYLMYKENKFVDIKLSYINQTSRVDSIDISWNKKKNIKKQKTNVLVNGAEANIDIQEIQNRKYIWKYRVIKEYRSEPLDSMLRSIRTKNEARMMIESRKIGVRTPIIYFVDKYNIIMEYIDGYQLKECISLDLAEKLGLYIGLIHKNNIIHGDLTTSNILIERKTKKLYLIDFGLSYIDKDVESKGFDLHVLFQTLESTHPIIANEFIEVFSTSYISIYPLGTNVLKRAYDIKKRGRYI